MAPMKRVIEASVDGAYHVDDAASAAAADGPVVKRLRGGGGNTAPIEEEQYFLEDEEIIEEHIPEEVDPAAMMDDQTVFTDISESMRQRWIRPSNQILDNSNDLDLQWFDMDVIGGNPLDKNPNESKSKVVGATTGQVPVVRAYGVTEAGNSVALFIHGFTPYGYFSLPAGATFEHTEENLTKVRKSVSMTQ